MNLNSSDKNCNKADVKIIVIGAGIAGIAATERLITRGFSNVTILEAEGRVGGRIHTREFEEGWIDMGAQWIHGQLSNPVYELACRHDLVDVVAQEAFSVRSLDYYMSNGQFIPASVILETSTILDNIFNEMTHYSREGAPVNDATVGSYVQEQFYKHLKDETDSTLRRMKEGLFNWRLIMEKTENACSSIYDMSLNTWGEYMECAGNDAVELSRGYRPILNLFLENIPSSMIQLNTRVSEILWDRTKCDDSIETKDRTYQCKIVTSDGRIFEADHVIVTCSLGFLKSNARDMFKPSLPDYKMSAIERLGFGTVNKIYLEFEKPFWRNQCKGIEFMWFPDESIELKCLEGLDEQTAELVKNAGEWYKAVHGFDVVAQHPDKLLCGWIAGKEAELMESLPDWLVQAVCRELLATFTGVSDVPQPLRIIRSSWKSGGLSRGSYSYRHTGSTYRDSYSLAQPLYASSNTADDASSIEASSIGSCRDASSFGCVHASSIGPDNALLSTAALVSSTGQASTLDASTSQCITCQTPVLLFAGEATHDTYFSTTHGALLSGQREAERLVGHYQINGYKELVADAERVAEASSVTSLRGAEKVKCQIECDKELANVTENLSRITAITA